jgi:UDP-N-acetylglucosamine acyltransferase
MAITIHPTAIVSSKAELEDDVTIGPYAVVEDHTSIESGTVVHHHAFIARGAKLGQNCVIHHSAVVGNVPQDLKFNGTEETLAVIGDGTIVREFATIHRATIHTSKSPAGTHDGVTRIGKNCLIMAYAHVAHDCSIGDNVILSNAVQIGGHVSVGYHAIVGGLSGIHQFSLIGEHAMVGASVLIKKDVPPYSLIGDNPVRFGGVNTIGLGRRGFSEEAISAIRHAYKLLYYSGKNVNDALTEIEALTPQTAEVQNMIAFIRKSERGIIGR